MNHKFNLIFEGNKSNQPELKFKSINNQKIVDFRNNFKNIYDQGSIGSCTANALGYVYNFIDDPSFDPSRLFLYYNSRLLDNDNDIKIDDGTTLTQGINVLKKYGVCSEKTWPYVTNKYGEKPNKNSYDEAVNYKIITSQYIIPTLNNLKGCLQSGYPFVCGILIFQSFMSSQTAKNGIVNMPVNKEKCLGGHAVTCIGYNDNTQRFIMLNSWGPSWGDKGIFYLPYNYLTNGKLSADFWKISKVNIPSNIPKKPILLKIVEKQKFFKK